MRVSAACAQSLARMGNMREPAPCNVCAAALTAAEVALLTCEGVACPAAGCPALSCAALGSCGGTKSGSYRESSASVCS